MLSTLSCALGWEASILWNTSNPGVTHPSSVALGTLLDLDPCIFIWPVTSIPQKIGKCVSLDSVSHSCKFIESKEGVVGLPNLLPNQAEAVGNLGTQELELASEVGAVLRD